MLKIGQNKVFTRFYIKTKWAVTITFCLTLNWIGCALADSQSISPTSTKNLSKTSILKQPVAGNIQGSSKLQKEEDPASAPQGDSGVYVMDNIDFHPIGGGEIPGLGWNNKVQVSGYYQYSNNSYVIVTGTVHGDGLISGPGQDGWTFVVKLNTTDIIGPRPSGCQFADYRRAQTIKSGTAWKYQQMIVFKDTASKPECFQYFKTLANKPFPVKLIDIVGPYWTGDKQYQEPKNRYYQTGPMLPVNSNLSSGHTAQPWTDPIN